MKTSIFSRIFGAMVLVSFLAVSLVTILTVRDQILIFHEATMKENKTVLDLLWAYSRESEGEKLIPEVVLEEVSRSVDISFLWIVDSDGELYYADNGEFSGMMIDDPFVGVETFERRRALYRERETEIIARPLVGKDGENWTVIAGVNRIKIMAFLMPAIARGSSILLLAVLISVFLSLFFTERIIRPLLKLKKAIIKIREGDMSQRIKINTGDEVQRIGEEFNEMAAELERSHRELEEAKQVLEIRVRSRTRELEELTESLEEKVEARTEELQRKVEELEKFHNLTVGREKKMIQLKEENEKIKEENEKLKRRLKNKE